MALRPPRAGFSVARRLSEQSRAAQHAERQAGQAAGDQASGLAGGLAGLAEQLRAVVGQLAEALQAGAESAADSHPEPDPACDPASDQASAGGTARSASRQTRLGPASMVFGYTLRMGREGMSAEPFGDVPPGPKAASGTPARPARAGSATAHAPLARLPIVEISEDGADIVVVAELPGAEPASLTCQAEGTRLAISAEGARRYRKDITLPCRVSAQGMRQNFENGILEVRLRRAEPA
jgi:HSP20 family protein